MDIKTDRWPNPGDLLHAALEGWVVAEISDATQAKLQPPLPIESRRGQGIQSSRASRASVSVLLRPSRSLLAQAQPRAGIKFGGIVEIDTRVLRTDIHVAKRCL
jgi:hypothetical protein